MLPGKLCIGILEEDNPLKSYFRLKPLLIYTGEGYEPFLNSDAYPSEGYLRIVPDKNESGRFKARMRRMGRYCLLDLRNHPLQNDKIRTNKNYGINPSENNANIVYSDVIKEPLEGMILDIASDLKDELVTTPNVLIGESNEVYQHIEEASGMDTYLAHNGTIIPEAELQRFELPGNNGRMIHFAVRISEEFVPRVLIAEPDPRRHITSAEPSPVSVVQIPQPADTAETIPVPVSDPEQIREQLPVSDESPAVVANPEPAPAASSRQSEEIIQPDEEVTQKKHHFPMVEKMMNSQAGLNPRGRMSLMEIIDNKWCRSRSDQLGHPIPGSAMGHPLENPVDTAVRSIREAWKHPETRRQLSSAIVEMRDVSEMLDRDLQTARNSAIARILEDLESDRLRTLAEIDQLRRDKALLRDTFKAEIRTEEAAAFADATARTKAAQEKLKALNDQVASAQSKADGVRDVLKSLTDGRFEKELQAFALKSRCFETIREMSHGDPCPSQLPVSDPDRSEWIDRIKSALNRRGLQASEIEVANLLVCTALADNIVLSGAYGSDCKLTVDALAEALGSIASERYIQIKTDPRQPLEHGIDHLLRKKSDIPGIIYTECTGPIPAEKIVSQPESGFISITHIPDNGSLSAELASDSWLLRLPTLPADAPWRIDEAVGTVSAEPASLQSLRTAFIGNTADIPAALADRLQRVRSALARHSVFLSRSILNDMLHYCSAMSAVCRISAGEALDRAFAQRALAFILTTAPIECLKELPGILDQLPISAALLNESLPIRI